MADLVESESSRSSGSSETGTERECTSPLCVTATPAMQAQAPEIVSLGSLFDVLMPKIVENNRALK